MLIKDRSDDAKDLFGWKWRSSGPTTKADFGSPTATTDYAVSVYDQSSAGPTLRLAATAPAGGVCWGDVLEGDEQRLPVRRPSADARRAGDDPA